MADRGPTDTPETGIVDGIAYTAADFVETTKPFEAVYKHHGDPFQEKRVLNRMAEVASALKVRDFKKTYQAYVKSLQLAVSSVAPDNIAAFDEQEIELVTGDWTADDTGVWKYGGMGSCEIACTHPIMPVERLRNIDTGELKVRLRFRRGSRQEKRVWSEILTDFDTVSNSKNIVKLSQIGISVTSGKRAQNLVDYLTDVMDLNYDLIPERKSVSRMGWNEEGFSPYDKGVTFDGNQGFAKMFDAIKQVGSYEAWCETAREVRGGSLVARIVLAASFASVLIQPIGALPFFVHLWGMDSGTGKTVSQMVAVSVWGNPTRGGPLFPTFKSTSVGFEVMAGFLNSLPVAIDELQLAKDSRGKLIFNVYELASGAGKLRSNKALGIASTPTWSNCFITSGESPLVGDNDGAGAINRVLEIECRADAKVIQDGRAIASAVLKNYGYAGRRFIEKLTEPGNIEQARAIYEAHYGACLENGTTEKQALAAAIILTGDNLMTSWIFEDDDFMTVNQVADFLKSKEQVSAGARGYAYICDWVTQNANRLRAGIDASGDVLGLIDGGYAYIIRAVFNKACQEAGISAPALLGYLKTRGLIQIRSSGKGMTVNKRVNRISTECVALKLPTDGEFDSEDWAEQVQELEASIDQVGFDDLGDG